MLRVAVPNKGALSEAASDMLSEAGYSTRRGTKTLVHQDEVNGVEFFYLRPRDIAIYVGSGILDAGITGRDLLLESQAEAQEVLGLGFGASRFFYAGTVGSFTSPDQLAGARIATSFPNLVDADLQRRGIAATTVQLDGAIEVSIQLGVADAIADVVETGSTLRAAGLETFGEPLLEPEGVLVQRAGAESRIGVLKRRLDRSWSPASTCSSTTTSNSGWCPKLSADPGLESPTVSPLQRPDGSPCASWSKRRKSTTSWTVSTESGPCDPVTNIGACRI